MPTNVILNQSGPIARIRFEASNEIHILSADTRRLLSDIIGKLDHDPECRVIIFEARGRTFLAGADLAELQGLRQDTAQLFAEAGQKLMNEIASLRAVTICAIQAACVGGGCELALACDFRLAATSARIGLPETSLGVIPGWGGTVRSSLLLGAPVARRIILTAELFSAEAALNLGLVDQIFPDDGLESGVEALVEKLLSRGPQALKRAKRLISQLTRSSLKKALAREARQFGACYASGEPAAGVAAFREKRAPAWVEATPVVAAPKVPSTPKLKRKNSDASIPVVPPVEAKTPKSKRSLKTKPDAE
ncbi:MAG: Enoyl-CoA hydratase/isomerase [Planctomycetaceae bacterium]|nr:Enoyl-CoA hydratase/isomerase [Planctomycetaceae bacterium]